MSPDTLNILTIAAAPAAGWACIPAAVTATCLALGESDVDLKAALREGAVVYEGAGWKLAEEHRDEAMASRYRDAIEPHLGDFAAWRGAVAAWTLAERALHLN